MSSYKALADDLEQKTLARIVLNSNLASRQPRSVVLALPSTQNVNSNVKQIRRLLS